MSMLISSIISTLIIFIFLSKSKIFPDFFTSFTGAFFFLFVILVKYNLINYPHVDFVLGDLFPSMLIEHTILILFLSYIVGIFFKQNLVSPNGIVQLVGCLFALTQNDIISFYLIMFTVELVNNNNKRSNIYLIVLSTVSFLMFYLFFSISSISKGIFVYEVKSFDFFQISIVFYILFFITNLYSIFSKDKNLKITDENLIFKYFIFDSILLTFGIKLFSTLIDLSGPSFQMNFFLTFNIIYFIVMLYLIFKVLVTFDIRYFIEYITLFSILLLLYMQFIEIDSSSKNIVNFVIVGIMLSRLILQIIFNMSTFSSFHISNFKIKDPIILSIFFACSFYILIVPVYHMFFVEDILNYDLSIDIFNTSTFLSVLIVLLTLLIFSFIIQTKQLLNFQDRYLNFLENFDKKLAVYSFFALLTYYNLVII